MLLAALLVAACARVPPRAEPPSFPPARATAPAQPPPAAEPPAPRWPALDREPLLAVLLARSARLELRLLVPHRLPDGAVLPAGPLTAVPAGDGGIAIAGRVVSAPCELAPLAEGPAFAHGGAAFAGRARLAREGGQLLLVEAVPLEQWLLGVLPAEMGPQWPEEALAAQAIVARSYAAARWQARAGQSWHLLRGTADVAYDGAVPPSAAVARAVARTRGLLLMHQGQAVLARFHACSGGRTEDSEALWPGATLVDGRTPLARFMPARADPDSEAGAAGLGWTATHQRWRAVLPLALLSERLAAWSAADARRPAIGSVRQIAVAERHPSGRVARVAVLHRRDGRERRDLIPAHDFRLAVGANRLRSLWWERVAASEAKGGSVVIEGRGFGHGVGLSQVSAWAMARRGLAAEDIVAYYFPTAELARRWR